MVHCVLAGRSSVFSTVSCILSRLLSDSGIIVGCQFFECVMLRLLGVFLFSASLVHRFPSLSSASQAATLPHPGCRASAGHSLVVQHCILLVRSTGSSWDHCESSATHCRNSPLPVVRMGFGFVYSPTQHVCFSLIIANLLCFHSGSFMPRSWI